LSRQAVGTFGKRGKTHTQLEPFFLISRPDSWRVVAGAAIPRVLPLFEELNNDSTAGPITLAHTGQRQQQPDVIKSLKSHSHDASANFSMALPRFYTSRFFLPPIRFFLFYLFFRLTIFLLKAMHIYPFSFLDFLKGKIIKNKK
jgi:hypothetical protein